MSLKRDYKIQHMLNLSYFKNLLEKEKTIILSQLKKLARISPKGGNDWEINPPETTNVQVSEAGEMANVFTKMEADMEIEKSLESELTNVDEALQRIEKGNYGICENGDEISEDRLKANPTAKTCVEHF